MILILVTVLLLKPPEALQALRRPCEWELGGLWVESLSMFVGGVSLHKELQDRVGVGGL